ncbi:hypothetical protein J1N35_043658 [Gossypium stocksii]|uniref:Uncharacterized protein n=1 Tax=Gossypium stocksii TaxID=47602 RepID=A0A9D3U7P5_9ROSI|nr:hypothetical protein J1N35_043658 [Gossypium stocksii]
MARDKVSTRSQKEMGNMQQEISKIQDEMTQMEARLEAKMDSKLREIKEEFRGDLRALLGRIVGMMVLPRHNVNFVSLKYKPNLHKSPP